MEQIHQLWEVRTQPSFYHYPTSKEDMVCILNSFRNMRQLAWIDGILLEKFLRIGITLLYTLHKKSLIFRAAMFSPHKQVQDFSVADSKE